LVDVANEFFEIKQVVTHLDLGLKAYRAATRDEIDATRLLESIQDEFDRLISIAGDAREKVHRGLAEPVTTEG
jgi:hypothetical protein